MELKISETDFSYHWRFLAKKVKRYEEVGLKFEIIWASRFMNDALNCGNIAKVRIFVVGTLIFRSFKVTPKNGKKNSP